MSQLAYNFNPAIGRHGLLADESSAIVLSKLAEGLVKVGSLVTFGTRGQVGPSATTADPYATSPGTVKTFVEAETDPIVDAQFVGISIYDSSRPPYTALDEYSDKDPVPVLRKGLIWINVPDATVTQFDPVYVWADPDGDVTYPLGTFLQGANAGKGILFPRGRYLTTSPAGGGLVVLEIW